MIIFIINANACITNHKPKMLIFIQRDFDDNFSLMSKLDRITHQIQNHMLQPILIHIYKGQARRQFILKLNRFLSNNWLGKSEYQVCNFNRIDRFLQNG